MLTKQQIINACDGKVSRALELMIEGLTDPDRGFEINMNSFGHENIQGVCFGCAATCATLKVHQKAGEAFDINFVARWGEDGSFNDVAAFESAINEARMGCLRHIFNFFGRKPPEPMMYNQEVHMDTENWRDELPQMQAIVDQLKGMGL